jgi:hypothetical protein
MAEATVQEILDAVAQQVALIPGIKGASATDIRQIQKTPYVILSWFSDIDTTIATGSDQLWIIAAKATLYGAPIRGNELRPSIESYNDLILPLVDTINKHPQTYPFGSQMAALKGVSRITVTRVRTAEFGLEYAGSRYFGAELFLDIKLHRRVAY